MDISLIRLGTLPEACHVMKCMFAKTITVTGVHCDNPSQLIVGGLV